MVEHVTAAAHMPPFTVADVIVTPDPFRDVIRTEAAPDLHSLIGDIMPYLWDQTASSTTPVSFTTLESRENSTTTSTTGSTTSSSTTTTTTTPSTTTTTTQEPSTTESTTASTTSTAPPAPTTTLTSLFDLLNFESTNKTVPQEEYDYKEVKEEEPSEDDFSFDSVFSYLFGNDKWTTTSEKPYPKTKKPYLSKPNITQSGDQKFLNKTVGPKFNQSRPSTVQTLEHRIDVDIDDTTNSLEKVSELDKTSNPTAASPLSNSETRRTTNAEPIIKLIATTPVLTLTAAPTTIKPTEPVVYLTSVRNVLTTPPSSTSQRPTEKTAYYSTARSPITKVSTKRYGTKYTSTPKYSRPPVTPATSLSKPDPGAASGLLKLAGCNIYGRMYRVGRIISELSGPCLECMCTEVGVQCRPLKC